jgi:hypothetical protein
MHGLIDCWRRGLPAPRKLAAGASHVTFPSLPLPQPWALNGLPTKPRAATLKPGVADGGDYVGNHRY